METVVCAVGQACHTGAERYPVAILGTPPLGTNACNPVPPLGHQPPASHGDMLARSCELDMWWWHEISINERERERERERAREREKEKQREREREREDRERLRQRKKKKEKEREREREPNVVDGTRRCNAAAFGFDPIGLLVTPLTSKPVRTHMQLSSFALERDFKSPMISSL